MSFNHPSAFFLFLLPILLYILRRAKIFVRPSYDLTLADWKGRSFEWQSFPLIIASVIVNILCISSYILLVCAIADPVVIESQKKYTTRGAEIVFVIDASPSMAAMDIGDGTRLDAAKKTISYLVSKDDGISYGLVANGLEAALLVPPTMDHQVFITQLESLSIGQLGDGSAIGTGLATAVYHLVSSPSPSKTIVLLTDGENNAGAIHPLTAAKLATENNIRIFVTGIGTTGSVPVKYTDPETGEIYSGYLDSSFDDTILKTIAFDGNGDYFSVQSIQSLQQALETASKASSTFQTYKIKQTQKSYYFNVLLLTIVLFSIAWIIRRVFMRQFI
ncbi:MAG: hypothetical protein BKP49_03160 [Treponema sp. CETP13]|nr:MAG: hypothetical protein BKP49_03160 [Treponema sp. CETP13]